jgi:hypothetical protein
MQAKLPEHNSMLTRWFRRRILGAGYISHPDMLRWWRVVVIARLVQGVFGVGGVAMLRRRIQTSEFRFQLDIFNKQDTQCAPHVAIGTRQDFIYGRLKRISFHQLTTAKSRRGSVCIDSSRRTSVPGRFKHRCVFGTASLSRWSKRPRE